MNALARAFFGLHADLRLAALGMRANAAALDLAPYGIPATYRAAEDEPELVRQYLATNRLAFPGPLTLPGWVLADLYLLPAAIALLLGPARGLRPEQREALGVGASGEAIWAAYYAAPTLHPGLFAGASMFSLVPGLSLAPWVKALGLRMLRAERVRGVAGWGSPALAAHTRLGPLRIVGPAAGAHELAATSFIYETDLRDPARLALAMERRLPGEPGAPAELGEVLARVAKGEALEVAPPALDAAGRVLVRRASQPSAPSPSRSP